MIASLYLIGSLRNPDTPILGNELRQLGFEVYDDWFAPGPETDSFWKEYESGRGHTYQQALQGYHARQIFEIDYYHLNRTHGAIFLLPAGKSGHLEMGFVSGQGKPVFTLLDDENPERIDIMTRFSYRTFFQRTELLKAVSTYPWPKLPSIPQITVSEARWLAGLLDGEGAFCLTGKTPRLVLQMTDRDVVAHAAQLFRSNIWGGKVLTKGGKLVWACGRAGLSAIEWMRILRPYLSSRRQNQILTTVQGWLEQRTYRARDKQWWEAAFHIDNNRLLREGFLQEEFKDFPQLNRGYVADPLEPKLRFAIDNTTSWFDDRAWER